MMMNRNVGISSNNNAMATTTTNLNKIKSWGDNTIIRKRGYKISLTTLVMLMISNGISFFAGALIALHVGMHSCSAAAAAATTTNNNKNVFTTAGGSSNRNLIRIENNSNQQQHDGEAEEEDSSPSSLFPPEVHKFAYGMIHTPKEDFASHFDMGVPLDLPQEGMEDVLILYSNNKAMPKKFQKKKKKKKKNNNNKNDGQSSTSSSSSSVELISTKEAIENCDMLNIVLTNHDAGRKQCLAIVPQYESYHIQKWMRVPKEGTSTHRKMDSKYELQPVSRGHQTNGREQFLPPGPKHTKQNWDMLRTYLSSIDDVINELKPIVDRITTSGSSSSSKTKTKTVIVMVCNFGQSELLINFACSAKARGLDISNVLVFATDEETKELAEGVGLAAYFDKRNFGDIPSEAADHYGDKRFVAMMMAKVICVQVVSLLGVDILFQDVDIVWYKNPLEFFHDKSSPIYDFDAYFQDDGAHSVRYAPWSSNSGFYYLRHNDKTQYFLNSLLMSGDLVLKTDSHQQALVAVMSEHASLYGLRVKVLSRDEDEFPGGYHYHQKTGKYMRAFFKGEKSPYIFHMSWTKNKDNKILFLKQLGQWYVHDKCIATKPSEIEHMGKILVHACCSAKELFSCHYRDKPSREPCSDSPPIDQNGGDFWAKK